MALTLPPWEWTIARTRLSPRKVPAKKTNYLVPDSTGWARFHIEPAQVLDYICEIIYEEKRRFEKYEQKCYSPRAIKHETIKGWET
jgi:hypothetical protein